MRTTAHQAPGGELWGALQPEAVLDLLDRLTDGLLVFDEEWRFSYANEPAARMLGHEPGGLLGLASRIRASLAGRLPHPRDTRSSS